MNWKVFYLKYDKQETWAFEQLSYLLFCVEFGNRIGLFRYKNQTGIETEPVEKDGVFYGFQAKYYTTSISDAKEDIIDSIEKAKSKNNQLKELLLYVNQELSESSKKDKKKPQYQVDIENSAKSVGVNIQWRVPSHFELQLALPENKYLHDMFFSLEPSGGDLLDEVIKHNLNILKAIQTEITFGDKQIKIDRNLLIASITDACQNKKNIIISGEGGCGKTAILKEFYALNSDKIPICIFKANELNVAHINDIFRFDHQFKLNEFLEVYKDEPIKIFVIDSAEKLAEITNNDILRNLIEQLKANDWRIIFTTRYAYLNDLTFHIRENYQLSFEVNDISLISNEDLTALSEKFEFSLPESQKFSERLTNLFYLNEYIQQYNNIDKQGNFNSFVDLLWKKRILNNIVQRDNMHLERERCIISIAKQRCDTGRFYINAENLPQSALFQLKQDEILGYEEVHSGYFIAHDIYEEWALAKIVSRCFSNYSNTKQFFDELGDSLPIRRAFRLWVSEHLANGSSDIESFIQGAFKNDEISQFWKDEILISVLLSDYSRTFFNLFENEIIENDFAILKRILFLLRIACTDISSFESIDVIDPKGKGWEEVISLVYKYKSAFFDSNLNLVLPVLTDWCKSIKTGKTTRYSGLLALSIIQKTETEDSFYMHKDAEEKILKVVFNSASEIQTELKNIFNKVIENKWTNHRKPYHGLCTKILEKPYIAIDLIKSLPLEVIQLCDLFWQKPARKSNDWSYGRESMESKYGLVDEFKFNYFPASANQTPIKWLLQVAFYPTLDFIINFTNRAVQAYSQSDYGKEDVEEITLYIDEIEVTQYLSWSLWGMYRGNGSPVVPYLLQSIHMALEKTLLEYAPATKPEIFEHLLLKILRDSKSASLTSIVCSAILANRDKLYNVALVLFKTIELFHIDTVRSTSEFHAQSTYGIGYGMDKLKDALYTDERLKTCKDEHRASNLESLFLNYQFFGVNGFTEEQNTEFIEKLHDIIDRHKSNDLSKKSSEILLLRMDRRNLTPKISEAEGNKFLVEFSPKVFPDELKNVSEQARSEFDDFLKYSALKTWSDFLIGRESQGKIAKHDEYDSNPIIALSETRQLVEEIKSGDTARGRDHSIPPFTCSKMLIEYKDKLQKEDIDFCKEIITSTLSRLFSDEYEYQISDGVEASFHAIPILINEYPEDVENIVSMMVLSLFDETAIGAYKRICDYVIESIHKSKLWEQNQKVAQSILFGYIKLKPIYKKIIDEKRKEQRYWRRIPKTSILEELDKITPEFTFGENSFDLKDIESLDIHGLEIVYQLIPSDTKDDVHLDIFMQTLPIMASRLLIDRRVYEEEFGDDHDIFKVRLEIFKRFSNFLLQREVSEIDKYLTPFLDYLSPTEETSLFIGEIITAEDSLMNREQFWHIWNKLFPKIKELSDYPRSPYLKQIIINYLLAWQFWKDRIEEWHSLSRENLSLYVNASKEMGHIPAVLYSIARVLNSVGSNFKNEGIDWVYTIVSNNKLLQLGDLESNTLYYLEMYLRKFVFNNRQEIKKEIRLKNKVIPILDFMIERGSVHAYLLRESIL